MPPRKVASLINEIFCRFDDCLITMGAKIGLFKIDTAIDSCEAAAFLGADAAATSGGGDGDGCGGDDAARRDAEICATVLRVAHAMVRVVKEVGERRGFTLGLSLHSRCGIASGWVVAGMLGKLQPRFHLLGAPVDEAQELEAMASLDSISISADVRASIESLGRPGAISNYTLVT